MHLSSKSLPRGSLVVAKLLTNPRITNVWNSNVGLLSRGQRHPYGTLHLWFFCTSAVANVHAWSTHVFFGCPSTQFYSLNGLLGLKHLLFIYTLKTAGAFSVPQRNKAGTPTSNLPSLLLLAGRGCGCPFRKSLCVG